MTRRPDPAGAATTTRGQRIDVTPLVHHGAMTTKRQRTEQGPKPEQLSLLAESDLPLQFRLDRRTRERGLAHIAEIRRQLAARRGRTPDWMQDAA